MPEKRTAESLVYYYVQRSSAHVRRQCRGRILYRLCLHYNKIYFGMHVIRFCSCRFSRPDSDQSVLAYLCYNTRFLYYTKEYINIFLLDPLIRHPSFPYTNNITKVSPLTYIIYTSVVPVLYY